MNWPEGAAINIYEVSLPLTYKCTFPAPVEMHSIDQFLSIFSCPHWNDKICAEFPPKESTNLGSKQYSSFYFRSDDFSS